MRKRGTKAPLITAAAAGALAIALLFAGTLMRMDAQGAGFGEAFLSFLKDTFIPGT